MKEEIPIFKTDKKFIKEQLNAIFKEHAKANTNQIDTTENLKETELLLKNADKCIGGTFKSYVNVEQVRQLEEQIDNNKNKSKFVTKIKNWIKKFIELCKNPSSLSKQNNLKKETEVLIKGQPIKIINAVPMTMHNAMCDMQNELKSKLSQQTVTPSEKKNALKRSDPVSQAQKDNGKKRISDRSV